ncbi:MAG TPA: LysE family transporter [Anaerolineae bacterium]
MDTALLATFFLQGAALGITAGASPGPLQTLLISESLLGGFRRGGLIAFAPLVTDVPIVLFMLFILKQLSPVIIRMLGLAGGLFVLYLAWGLWKQWRAGLSQDFEASEQDVSRWTTLRRGALTNLINPNPYLFWGLVGGPILISAFDQAALYGLAFLAGMYGIFIGSLLALAALFHLARRLGPRIVRGLLLVSIVILIVFGGILIRNGIVG